MSTDRPSAEQEIADLRCLVATYANEAAQAKAELEALRVAGAEEVETWIEKNFTGHGRAARRQSDAPIPGEPFMSMEDAKELVRQAVATFCADAGVRKVLAGISDGEWNDLITVLARGDRGANLDFVVSWRKRFEKLRAALGGGK